jgi:hypothetical protein
MSKNFNPTYLHRLRRMHQLIQEEHTGTPAELGAKLNISERSVFLILDYFKDNGAEINYDRKRKTYFYPKPFELKIKFYIKCISDDEMRIIEGGNLYSPARILQGNKLALQI